MTKFKVLLFVSIMPLMGCIANSGVVPYDGDLNRDGKVDLNDMADLAADWLNSYGLSTFQNVSQDWKKDGGLGEWTSDLFDDNEGSAYSGWTEGGGTGLYKETNSRLEWGLGSDEINHIILNKTMIESERLDIHVDAGAFDNVGTFYLYFLYQDSSNWYRLKIQDIDSGLYCQLQRKINGTLSDVAAAGGGVDISANQPLVHWQVLVDLAAGSLTFLSESNEVLNVSETFLLSNGRVGLGGSGRRPIWDNFHVNNDGYVLDNGYDLWLRYHEISDAALSTEYRNNIKQLVVEGISETFTAIREELSNGLDSLLASDVPVSLSLTLNGAVVIGTPATSTVINGLGISGLLNALGDEGYVIQTTTSGGKDIIAISSISEKGALYGAFHFLRLLQTHTDIGHLNIQQRPKIKRRVLNHWDNLESIERGYAGSSIWKWDQLPGTLSPRYKDYARACASVGINGMVPNNVNASSTSLTTAYIDKLAALADVFRPYGVRVYLTAKFSAPIDIGGLSTADPLNADVVNWWDNKVNEIYARIPDFGGFLVKANSEGQPGPNDYGRTHAQGANMMASVLDEHGGVVMWRAFVYSTSIDPDRAKHAYMEFKPLDGQFHDNVFVQIKNGPLDFQPSEPFTPLFGGFESTNYGAELQITQEYLGRSTHLVYLAPMWKEFLDFDTHAYGTDSTVGRTLDGTLSGKTDSLIAGVANIGDDANWCGHHFAQSNWYAFGRLAWDYTLTSDAIADEWIRMTWSNAPSTVTAIKQIMLGSYPATRDYFTPIGLNFLAKVADHYNPDPAARTYFHKADGYGLGFDRTTAGSDAVSQYHPSVRDFFNNPATCPDDYLLWFHHVSWDHVMHSGKPMWDELCFRYYRGAAYAANMIDQWDALHDVIDKGRFDHVRSRLISQYSHSILWRDTCVNYFQGYSNKPLPTNLPE
jgi:alpha-glucuronidase